MKKTFIPFLYKVNNTFVFRRKKDLKTVKTKIFYGIDFLTYTIIDKEYDMEEFTIKDVNKICVTIVEELNKRFLD